MLGQRQVFPGAGELPFSAATKADGLIYVAGTLATEGDIKAQTKNVLDQMSQTLTKAGSSMAQVAAVHVYIKNASEFAAMNEVYRTYWPKNPPDAHDDRRRISWCPARWSKCRWSRSRTAASAR